MKFLGIILFSLVAVNLSLAQDSEEVCQARIKSYASRSALSEVTVTLDVYSKCALESAEVEAFLGKKKVSKNATIVERHAEETLDMYSFTVSKDVAKRLDLLNFKIRGKGTVKRLDVFVNQSLFKKGSFEGEELAGSGRVKKISQSVTNGNLRLIVKVDSDINLNAYPALVVSLNGIDLNRYEMNYYAHLAGETQEYRIDLPEKYTKMVKQMSFRIVQSNQTYLELKR